jgi:hypothetical protein
MCCLSKVTRRDGKYGRGCENKSLSKRISTGSALGMEMHENNHLGRIKGMASLGTKGIMDSTKLSIYILFISRFMAVLCLIGYGVYTMKVIRDHPFV